MIMETDANFVASLQSLSDKKRKRPDDDNQTAHRDCATKPVSGVRTLIADLKNGKLNETETQEKLRVLEGGYFPRHDEWLVGFYLERLSRRTKASTAQHECVHWRSLSILCQTLPSARLKIAIRKSNFVQLLRSSFEHGDAQRIDVLNDILTLLQLIYETRSTRSVLLTSLDVAYSTLLAFLQSPITEPDVQNIADKMVGHLVSIIRLSVEARASTKKLQEIMYSSGLEYVVNYLEKVQETTSIKQLFSLSIFSESGLTNSTDLAKALKQISGCPGSIKLCRLSFECLNDNVKSDARRLECRNTLLGVWLSKMAAKRGSILQAYQITLPTEDSNISRPLSSDTTLMTELGRHIGTALDRSTSDLSFIASLLELDLDTVFPEHSDLVWAALDRAAAHNGDLASVWLTAHVDIRALPDFIEKMCRLQNLDKDIMTVQFLSKMALAFSKAVSKSQDSMITTVLQSQSPAKIRLLTAMIAGLQSGSHIVLNNIDDLLKCCQTNESWANELRRVILLGTNSTDFVKIAAVAQESLKTALNVKDDTFATIESWLRVVELSASETLSHPIEGVFWINSLLHQCLEDSENGRTRLRAVADRWLPVLCPMLDEAQKQSLVGALWSTTADSSVPTHPLLIHTSILENAQLHGPLQEMLSNVADVKSRSYLKYVPVIFFHKAVRRQMLDALIQMNQKDVSTYEALLKLAAANVLPNFEQAEDYVRFATTTMEESREQSSDNTETDHSPGASDKLRQIYVKALSDEHCKMILDSLSVPLLLRIEVYEDLQNRNHVECSYVALVESIVRNCRSQDSEVISPVAIHQFVRLARCHIDTTQTREVLDLARSLLDDSTEKHDVLTVQLSQILTSNTPITPVRRSFEALELMCWMANDSDSADSTLQHLGSARFSTSQADSQKCYRALALTLKQSEIDVLVERYNAAHSVTAESRLVAIVSLLSELANVSDKSKQQAGLVGLSQNVFWISTLLREKTTTEPIEHLKSEGLLFFQAMFDNHPRSIHLSHLDSVFCAIARVCQSGPQTEQIILQAHKLLQSSFEHHAQLLRDRYHVVVNLFQNLLRACASKVLATSLVRLFGTFLTCSRRCSTKPELFNKAFSKHLPWLLIEYLNLIVSSASTGQLTGEVKRIVEEGLIYEVMGLCGTHEREMIGASVDSTSRGMFKKLFDEWNRFGKWREN